MRLSLGVLNDEKTILAIDTHTMGEPTRIVIDGFPELEGNTMIEKKKFLEENYDSYRQALMLEPRGHKDMFGAILTKPIDDKADFGAIFMDNSGYLNMCGHGSIGIAAAAVETGLVEVKEPYTYITIETPAGMINVKAKVEKGKVKEVTIKNVPSFVYKENIVIKVCEKNIPIDICFGGSFFALVDSDKIGYKISNENLEDLIEIGMNILKVINDTITIKHPYLAINTVDLVEFYGETANKDADLKNVVVLGQKQFDRSPCGTGTSAKLAYLHSKGMLKLGEEFRYESITGSIFRGIAVEETKVGDMNAIIPEITGNAYVTGINKWILDKDDPQKFGFLL